MTRVFVSSLSVSIALTAATVITNYLVRTEVGPARFWADMSGWSAIASWVTLAMFWCTDRIVAASRNGWKTVGKKVEKMETRLTEVIAEVEGRLEAVEDSVSDIDRERVQAHATVVALFRDRQAK